MSFSDNSHDQDEESYDDNFSDYQEKNRAKKPGKRQLKQMDKEREKPDRENDPMSERKVLQYRAEFGHDRKEFDITSDMDSEKQFDTKKKLMEFDQMIKQKEDMRATYKDIRDITIRRSKIEQWVDEPFFQKTMIGSLVKVAVAQNKFRMGEIKSIIEKVGSDYSMTNGKKTNVQLNLMITQNKPESIKSYKLNQISNQEVTEADYEELKKFRIGYKEPMINQKEIFFKKEEIQVARNYIYKDGERELV